MVAINAETRSLQTYDELARVFTKLSGTPCFSILDGSRRFLSAFGAWFRSYEAPTESIAILPPNPTHATTFWTPLDDLRAAVAFSQGRTGDLDTAILESPLNLSEHLLNRPVYTLSAGERALVALAKCYFLIPSTKEAIICDPSPWLHKSRRPVLRDTLLRRPPSFAPAKLLTLAADAPIEQAFSRPSPLEWALVLNRPVVAYPPRRFPCPSLGRTIVFENANAISLHSPTVIRGDNGAGKTTLAYVLARILSLKSGEASVVVDSLRRRPRMLTHDSTLQLFGMSPREHTDWVFRVASTVGKEAWQIYESIMSSITTGLGKTSPLGAIGDAERVNTLLQAKCMLVSERLAGKCDVLILDEPTWGLCDQLAFGLLRATIDAAHKKNVRVLVISHHDQLPAEMFASHVLLNVLSTTAASASVHISTSGEG